jgi:hypothetical protein
MAQTGFTPIQLYSSSTATNVPLAANLATGELAINITDGKLFYKDNAAAVQVIGWKVVPATAGGTGQTSYAVGDLLYADTTTTLAKLPDVATGNALISGGVSTAPSWGKIGLTTHVSGTLPTANGGTNLTSFTSGGVVYASSTSALTTGSALNFNGNALGINTAANSSYQIRMDAASPLFGMMVGGTQAFTIGANGGGGATFYYGSGNVTSGTFAADWTISNGNLVIGTSGKGIDFSITSHPAGMTSELLADYEEGTWTPVYEATTGTLGTVTYANVTGIYTKVGNLVTISGGFYCSAFAVGTGSGALKISGLPYTSAAVNAQTGAVGDSRLFTLNNPTGLQIATSATNLILFYRTTANGDVNVLQVSDAATGSGALNLVYFTASYRV